MANIKSAKKRILQTQKKTEFNRFIKSRVRTKIKKIFGLIKSKNKDEAKINFLSFESDVSKAMSKGVFKKNTASRLVSRLSKKVKNLK
ncbi:MAG: 30S ribosomal protein S20 [Alphaproteobacteria bacterium]|tara:strand:- start:10413 stop:10676 length:264 start_codon:yes stop_codon:yes gene_type:complete